MKQTALLKMFPDTGQSFRGLNT